MCLQSVTAAAPFVLIKWFRASIVPPKKKNNTNGSLAADTVTMIADNGMGRQHMGKWKLFKFS